jgi:hypothetical protein
MDDSVLIGQGTGFERKPLEEWLSAVRRGTENMKPRLSFMTAEHHAVRNFVVTGLARLNRPLPPQEIASRVGLTLSRVQEILAELERRLFFLVRNQSGEVAWAFPITSDRTPHELQYSTGERTFGACAEDAFAAPFVLGRLLGRRLDVALQTRCRQSCREMCLTVGSDRTWRVETEGADHVLLFVPSVNWEEFRGENIIDAY